MDLDGAFHIKEHCRVNENKDGDRFVGIKADFDGVMAYFPIRLR